MTLAPDPAHDDFRRLPGLFRRWELAEVCESGRSYRIEHAGTHGDGTALLALYVSGPSPCPLASMTGQDGAPHCPDAQFVVPPPVEDGSGSGMHSAIRGQPGNDGCGLRCLKALTRLLEVLAPEGAPETPSGTKS